MRRPSFTSILYFFATVLWIVLGIFFKNVLYFGLAILTLWRAIATYDKK